ncbi:DUF4199 domain-containing protein [Flavobacterium orientale]|uniref:DUF4199 domain-containing protein n=1 Tax=Flavobacterium orientale TaxID=1756020 RepID=A0A917DE67_9FLAO|nr:DUF4199 domain-containing protein [Flavobacterium orientale]GGD29632.1 hypothetical protein GCM10011343_19780 [Flavobacterium orientale]
METQKQSIKNLIFTYGSILALLSILVAVVKYVMGRHLENSAVDSILGLVLLIALVVYPILQFKKQNNGRISLSESLKIGMGVAAVAAVLSVIYFIIFANYIEPNFVDDVLNAEISKQIKANPSMSSEDLAKGMEMGRSFVLPMLYGGIIVVNLFLGFITSLITGLAIKKD